jgi:protein SCO1/2
MSIAPEGNVAAQVASAVSSICNSSARREELVDLLAEQSWIYRNLASGDAERIRGFVLASFEKVGLPQIALPIILEELETGINPYTVAAAAKALRGAAEVSDATFVALVAAANRIASNDDTVQYDSIDPEDRTATRTSALAEIIRTVAILGPRPRPLWAAIDTMAASGNVTPEAMAAIDRARICLSGTAQENCCCTAPPPLASPTRSSASCNIDGLALEDQSGINFYYKDFFHGRCSIVSFFYTRCMNPQKCSLTISKLATVQRQLAAMDLAARINIGVFTYDPAYDHAGRLRVYGIDRGFRFDERNRFIRTVGSFEPVRVRFDLGVGFGPATVNQHSVELMILDKEGNTVREFRRVPLHESEIVRAVGEIFGTTKSN